jgi:hypothetical protein
MSTVYTGQSRDQSRRRLAIMMAREALGDALFVDFITDQLSEHGGGLCTLDLPALCEAWQHRCKYRRWSAEAFK